MKNNKYGMIQIVTTTTTISAISRDRMRRTLTALKDKAPNSTSFDNLFGVPTATGKYCFDNKSI